MVGLQQRLEGRYHIWCAALPSESWSNRMEERPPQASKACCIVLPAARPVTKSIWYWILLAGPTGFDCVFNGWKWDGIGSYWKLKHTTKPLWLYSYSGSYTHFLFISLHLTTTAGSLCERLKNTVLCRRPLKVEQTVAHMSLGWHHKNDAFGDVTVFFR